MSQLLFYTLKIVNSQIPLLMNPKLFLLFYPPTPPQLSNACNFYNRYYFYISELNTKNDIPSVVLRISRHTPSSINFFVSAFQLLSFHPAETVHSFCISGGGLTHQSSYYRRVALISVLAKILKHVKSYP